MEDNTKYNQIVDRINALDEVIKRNKKEQEFDNIKPEYEMNDIARGYFNPSIDDNFSHDPMFNDSYDHLKFGNNYFYNSEFVKRPLDDPSRIHESVHRVPNASMYRNSKNTRKDSKLELKRESKLQSKINSTLIPDNSELSMPNSISNEPANQKEKQKQRTNQNYFNLEEEK